MDPYPVTQTHTHNTIAQDDDDIPNTRDFRAYNIDLFVAHKQSIVFQLLLRIAKAFPQRFHGICA